MNTMKPSQSKLADVKAVIELLKTTNTRIERLLGQLPTTDDKILAELDTLINRQKQIMMIQTTPERGSLFYEQACGKAMSLRERYSNLLTRGQLRRS